jgi:hypothetical protein
VDALRTFAIDDPRVEKKKTGIMRRFMIMLQHLPVSIERIQETPSEAWFPSVYDFPAYIRHTKLSSAAVWKARVEFPTEAGDFSLFHGVQTGCGTHSSSYTVGTSKSSSGDKVAGARS